MCKAKKVFVIGGCGHVGLPLAILSASKGHSTTIYDIDKQALEKVRRAEMPFLELDADQLLKEVLDNGMLRVTGHPKSIQDTDIIILVVGTPVDEHLNPRVDMIFKALDPCLPYFRDGQVVILRSTVFPGVSAKVQDFFHRKGLNIDVTFCPERIVQGYAVREIQNLPQIVSGFSKKGMSTVCEYFSSIVPKVIELEPMEAELAKLFTNAYRYIEFAIANQFYMVAESEGVDYFKVHNAIKNDYPRMANIPSPGFTAGPCLFKDTMQLSVFYHHHFSLGLSSVWINEGLVDFVVARLKKDHNLREMTVGILGMAFKANSDDIRDSLSYKLRRLLLLEAKTVLCHDPLVRDPDFVSLEYIFQHCNVVIVGAPHDPYRDLDIPENIVVVDIWNCVSGRRSGRTG